MKALGAKILAVMSEVGKVGKDKTNAFHKYDYASDEAVVGSIRAALIKNRLVVLPNQTECRVEGELTTLGVDYTLLDADSGESIVSRAYGQGADKGDKGAYKAATGAEKYFLLKTFLIATGDDAEKESPERRPVAQTPPKSNGGSSSTQPQAGGLLTLTSAFTLSEPVKSKTGRIFRKAMDSEGASYFVWEDAVTADLQLSAGKVVTVEYEAGKFPTIKRVLSEEIPQGA